MPGSLTLERPAPAASPGPTSWHSGRPGRRDPSRGPHTGDRGALRDRLPRHGRRGVPCFWPSSWDLVGWGANYGRRLARAARPAVDRQRLRPWWADPPGREPVEPDGGRPPDRADLRTPVLRCALPGVGGGWGDHQRVGAADADQRRASGAICGILGGLLGFLVVHRRAIPPTVLRHLTWNVLGVVAFMVMLGLLATTIDQAGPLGGWRSASSSVCCCSVPAVDSGCVAAADGVRGRSRRWRSPWVWPRRRSSSPARPMPRSRRPAALRITAISLRRSSASSTPSGGTLPRRSAPTTRRSPRPGVGERSRHWGACESAPWPTLAGCRRSAPLGPSSAVCTRRLTVALKGQVARIEALSQYAESGDPEALKRPDGPSRRLWTRPRSASCATIATWRRHGLLPVEGPEPSGR